MNKTTNYQLNQWDPDDKVQRVDFNADNAKIDAAIKAVDEKVPKIKAGWYRGDGAASQRIELGFVPNAVITFCSDPPSRSGGSLYGGTAVIGSWPQMKSGTTSYDGMKIIMQGFTVYENSSVGIHCNMKDVEYTYVAIKV